MFPQPLRYLRTLISKEEFVDETVSYNSIATKAAEFPARDSRGRIKIVFKYCPDLEYIYPTPLRTFHI